MRIASPPQFMTVVRTDKETRLKNFIVDGAGYSSDEDPSTQGITLLVRNPDSPVARALYVAIADGQASGTGLKVLFGEAFQQNPAQTSILDVEGAEFRVLADARLGAAHEQLVIGKTHVWIGDCLRRDPTKRDAFEAYSMADTAMHRFSAASFRNMWAIARPFIRPKGTTVAPEIIASGQADEANAPSTLHRR